jgi:hypothetical protein
MSAGSFDIDTSREMLGHERALVVETKARSDLAYEPPTATSGSYWSRCQSSFEWVVYNDQFKRRVQRKARSDADTHNYNPPEVEYGTFQRDAY